MRGAPLQQAFFLLLTLLGLGVAGYSFLHHDIQSEQTEALRAAEVKGASSSSAQVSMVDAEVELTFSSPPVSYQLRRLNAEEKPIPVASSSAEEEIENPAYVDASLPAHQMTTYWLDVTWPDAPAENALHFVKITLSPSFGKTESFSFSCDSRAMNETFDYTNEEHSHDD